jgi:hypothetical protein
MGYSGAIAVVRLRALRPCSAQIARFWQAFRAVTELEYEDFATLAPLVCSGGFQPVIRRHALAQDLTEPLESCGNYDTGHVLHGGRAI